MKLRAVHLLRRLDTIDRDLQELETLQERIRNDRIYADRLRSSLAEEAVRLRNLKARILSQVIRNPPAGLQTQGGLGPVVTETDTPPGNKPEIILPTKRARVDSPAQPIVEGQSASRKTPRAPGREKSRGPGTETEEPESFEFRYE